MRGQTRWFSEALSRFTPSQISAIHQAYQDALDLLGLDAGRFDRRAALANVILDLALDGELDEARLCSEAVVALQRSLVSLRSQPPAAVSPIEPGSSQNGAVDRRSSTS